MIDVIVAGAAGRMGGRIIQAVYESSTLKLGGACERPDHPAVGQDAGILHGLGDLGVKISGNIQDILSAGQVIIEFTQPQATLAHLEAAAKAGLAMVIGTTGFSLEEMARLQNLAQWVPVVQAPNMSVGVNLLYKVVGEVARVLGSDFDIEIVEAHHRLKKDAPSGTAVKLAEVLAEATGRRMSECGVYGRQGMVGARPDNEIAVLAVRAGDIVGDHTVIFGGIGERIEITHRAHSRDTFARGAARAAAWVADKKAGLFDMRDVLGLR